MFTADASCSNFVPFSTHVDTHVVKTREGDYLITWMLSGFPFVGREDWELEHRHKAFNSLLQSLRAPDFENLAFWAHDIRRRIRQQLRAPLRRDPPELPPAPWPRVTAPARPPPIFPA